MQQSFFVGLIACWIILGVLVRHKKCKKNHQRASFLDLDFTDIWHKQFWNSPTVPGKDNQNFSLTVARGLLNGLHWDQHKLFRNHNQLFSDQSRDKTILHFLGIARGFKMSGFEYGGCNYNSNLLSTKHSPKPKSKPLITQSMCLTKRQSLWWRRAKSHSSSVRWILMLGWPASPESPVRCATHITQDKQRPTLHWDATGTCHRSGGQRFFFATSNKQHWWVTVRTKKEFELTKFELSLHSIAEIKIRKKSLRESMKSQLRIKPVFGLSMRYLYESCVLCQGTVNRHLWETQNARPRTDETECDAKPRRAQGTALLDLAQRLATAWCNDLHCLRKEDCDELWNWEAGQATTNTLQTQGSQNVTEALVNF